MYLTTTHLDLMYNVSRISRFMAIPTEVHLAAAKRMLRCLKGRTRRIVFTDNDYTSDIEDHKKTSGLCFPSKFRCGCMGLKKQPITTLSMTEAEFIAAASCASQTIWMRRVLTMLGQKQRKCTAIHYDNTSKIKLSRNLVMHRRSQQIDVRFQFLRDLTKEGDSRSNPFHSLAEAVEEKHPQAKSWEGEGTNEKHVNLREREEQSQPLISWLR
ncbi:LOW QUALITY PROTEIN: hypothetical protein OSB04_002447 [Centaurea solstitialis]|uniref:Uncharacterized protein n=1 Tax=Centaurea solstitialis TaxID=347529 RepID=A0AA38WVB8_9ASTR|nr:LOW QUALITY PROTEIN: hypothetical protein OSB04_002447 [Centaurea solstitialis]